MQVYCSQCKFFWEWKGISHDPSLINGPEECCSDKNSFPSSNYREAFLTAKKPSEINKDNDCAFFEKKEGEAK